MTVYRLPPGAVLLTEADLDICRYAVDVTQRARARNGLPPSSALARLAAALAAPGQTDSTNEPTEHDGHQDEVGRDEPITVAAAAELLRCSTRTVRRLAPRLGGRRVGGQWLLDSVAVTEHATEGDPHQ